MARLLSLLLLFLPAFAQAQFTTGTTNGQITITGYTGPGGAVSIPGTINGLPVTSIGTYAFQGCTNLTSVTIPSSVTSIGYYAFYQCLSLKIASFMGNSPSMGSGVFASTASGFTVYYFNSATGFTSPTWMGCPTVYLKYTTANNQITITGGSSSVLSIPSTINSLPVTSIWSGAFKNQTGLTSVTIPNSVTSIGTSVFQGCTNLTSVTIPSSVTGIGTYTFQGCSSLTSVTIPNSVTSIGNYAFQGCTNLTSVTIPNSVTSIGFEAFSNCSSLTSITVDPLNSFYSSVSGVLFDKLQTTLIQCPAGIVGNVTIPGTVTSIGVDAFSFCSSLTGVTIPDSVTSIGAGAFSPCISLTSVTIPNGVTSIGDATFNSCTGLTSVTIPNSVTSIGAHAFSFCSSLTSVTIPGSVTSIGNYAFYGCSSLTSVTIPNSVTSIGTSAFSSCSSLASIIVAATNPAYSSVDGVLFDKIQFTLIQYPGRNTGSYTIPPTVTSIGTYAFQGCGSLTSVTIPNSVTSIGTSAFSSCSSLTSVAIPSSVTSIGNYAFGYCTRLKIATFFGNAPLIGASVFVYAASGFTVYYFNSATGFTSPTWKGSPSVNMGAYSPVAPWLLSKGFPYNANLQSAPNRDGVSLLMAYALNLEPALNQSGSLPRPVFTANQMSLTFYAGSAGVTYTVQSSTDLQNWSTTGVTLSGPDVNNCYTATVPVDGTKRFMRLMVSY